MTGTIAVIVDENDDMTSFETGRALKIFSNENGSWDFEREVPFTIDSRLSPSEIRTQVKSTISEMGDCRIIAGRSVSGLPYNILDRLGFAIFEAEALTAGLLEDIMNELEQYGKERSSMSDCPTSPVPTEMEGVYFLNLIDLQEKHPEISSKRALQTFIEANLFYQLEVIVSHVPPWFDTFLPPRCLTYELLALDKNLYKVIISKKLCHC